MSSDFSFEAIRQQLSQSGDGIVRDRTWIERSLAEPELFAAALFRHASERSTTPTKSQFGIAYNFYHDAVTRHAMGPLAQRPCFLYPAENPAAPLLSLTYLQLHFRATQLAAEWSKKGVGAGVIVCVIYPTSVELVIALCAALKLGAAVCVLPPLGPDFLATRLQALQPRHIVTAKRYQSLLKEWYGEQEIPLAEALLPEVGPHPASFKKAKGSEPDLTELAQEGATSHSYQPGERVLGVCSEQREPSWMPIAVAAGAVYIGAFTDGVLLGLSHKGCVLAAPSHPQLQYQPLLLLMMLLHGGTFLNIGVEELTRTVEESPRLPGIDVLLMHASARDEMLARPARPLPEVRAWLCAVTEIGNQFQWRDWVERCGLGSVPATCWHYDVASAGCLLFSLQSRGLAPQIVYPALGKPFHLKDPAVEDQPARGPNGILRPLPGSCGILLYEYATGFIYGGTRWPTNAGRSIASGEVEKVVSALPFVAGAVMSPEPSDRGVASLLVFLGPHLRDLDQSSLLRIEQKIRDWIRVRMGREYVPRGVHLLATLPRRTATGIDHNWCIRQFREGLLTKRSQDPVLHVMDKLSFACHRAATPLGHLALRAQVKRNQERS